jgi:hypothetical protein
LHPAKRERRGRSRLAARSLTVVVRRRPTSSGNRSAGSTAARPTATHPATSPPANPTRRNHRYGHSQVREDFELNSRAGRLRLFPDLLGFRPVAAERAIEWDRLFDVPGRPPAQRAKLIDGTLVPSLIALPHAITGEVEAEAYRSLAGRDLQRGHAYGLPSGERRACDGRDAAKP